MPTLGPRRCKQNAWHIALDKQSYDDREDDLRYCFGGGPGPFEAPELQPKLPMKGEIWSVRTPLRRFVEVLEDTELPEAPSTIEFASGNGWWKYYMQSAANDHKLIVRMWHPTKDQEKATTIALGNFEKHIENPLELLAMQGL